LPSAIRDALALLGRFPNIWAAPRVGCKCAQTICLTIGVQARMSGTIWEQYGANKGQSQIGENLESQDCVNREHKLATASSMRAAAYRNAPR
jgi:hypothetical protein